MIWYGMSIFKITTNIYAIIEGINSAEYSLQNLLNIPLKKTEGKRSKQAFNCNDKNAWMLSPFLTAIYANNIATTI